MEKALAVGFDWRIHHGAPQPAQSVFEHRFPGGDRTIDLVEMGPPAL